MKISILTLFPTFFTEILSKSILGRATEVGAVQYELVDLRQFGKGTHKSVDDRPYGGGPGMVLRADVLSEALKSVINKLPATGYRLKTILMSASGKTFTQAKAREFSKIDHLIITCGHYEGIDQRFIDLYVDEEISIGDYVLTGGEIPAMAVVDATVRLLPRVLKKEGATEEESFSSATDGLLEYPQYTRPEIFEGKIVPEILRTGYHQKIRQWRKKESIEKTKKLRPDLLK